MPPRKLGQLVSDSFDAFYSGLALYGPILLVGAVPGILASPLGRPAAGLVNAIFGVLAYVAFVLAADARLRGEDQAVGDAFGRVPGVLGSLLVAELIAAAFIFGGLILLVIPGLILAIRYSLTHLAVLLEGREGRAALGRSSELLTAHMGKILGNSFVIGLITAGLQIGITVVLAISGLPGLISGGIGSVAHKLVGGWGTMFAIMLYRDIAALHPDAGAAGAVAAPAAVAPEAPPVPPTGP